jgi:hypothetical protein
MALQKFRLGRKEQAKLLAAAVDAGFHGADACPGDRRDLLVVIAMDIGQQDDLALFERQILERSLNSHGEFFPFDELCGGFRRIRDVERAVVLAIIEAH